MKNRLSLISLTAVALLSAPFFAGADNLAVGVFSSKVLLEESPQAKDVQSRMEKEFGPRKVKLEAREKELKEKISSYERDRAVLGEKDKLAKEREISRLQQEFQRLAQELNIDAQTKQKSELEKFNAEVQAAVEKVAKEKKLELVLPSHIAAYSSDSIDITDNIMQALKK